MIVIQKLYTKSNVIKRWIGIFDQVRKMIRTRSKQFVFTITKNVLFEIGLGPTDLNPIQVETWWDKGPKTNRSDLPWDFERLKVRTRWVGCPYEGRWAYMNGLEYSVERQKEPQSQIFNFIIWNHVWLVKYESSAWRPIDYLIFVGLTKVISWLIIPLKDSKPNINLQEMLL